VSQTGSKSEKSERQTLTIPFRSYSQVEKLINSVAVYAVWELYKIKVPDVKTPSLQKGISKEYF